MARAPAAAAAGMPRLSYAQLFSFQIAYANNFDSRGYVPSGAFALLGRKSNTFNVFRRYVVQDDYSDDLLISLRFEADQWEIMVQNILEKKALVHLLECIMDDVSPEEAAETAGKKGIVGLERNIMKYGLVYRRAKTAYKKDERFLIVTPGKLLLFKGMDITGKHARTVTSLFKATVRMIYGQLEFEVNSPNCKPLSLIPATAEDLTGWIGVIEKSIHIANGDEDGSHRRSPRRGSQDSKSSRRGVDIDSDNKPKRGRVKEEEDGLLDEDKTSQRMHRHRDDNGRSKGRHSINSSRDRYDMEERDFSSDGEYKPTPHREKYLPDKARKRGKESPSSQGKNKSSTQQRGSVNDYQVGRNYNDVEDEEGYIEEEWNTGYERKQTKSIDRGGGEGHVGVGVNGKYHERRGENEYQGKKKEEEHEKGKGKEKEKDRGKEEDEEDRGDGHRQKGAYQGRREDVFEGCKDDKKHHERRRDNECQGKKQEEIEKVKGKEKERGKQEDEEDRGDGHRWTGGYQGRREDVFEGAKEDKSGYEKRGKGFQGRREDEEKQQKKSIPHKGREEDGQRNTRQKGKQQGNYEGEEECRVATRAIGVQCQIAEDEKNQDVTKEVRRRSKESFGPQIQRTSLNFGRSPKELQGGERKKKTQEESSNDDYNDNEEEEEEEEEQDDEEEEPEEKDTDGGYVVKGSSFIMPSQTNSLPPEEVVVRNSSRVYQQQGTTKGSISTLNTRPHAEEEEEEEEVVEEYPTRSLNRPVFPAIAARQPLFNGSSKSAPMWASQQIPPLNHMNFSVPIRPPFPSSPPQTQQNR